ncbi:hypothetical protein HG66A1_19290 [Gimesia chilikensis]|uniref:Uncharacterized protein n=1 Tax=Gimesia chilikensis TaxID=2605989 RepID=A0A517PL95_9PLAN|nr:hypothetical protein HG66A1_19290 [Gimesia chilikensis]
MDREMLPAAVIPSSPFTVPMVAAEGSWMKISPLCSLAAMVLMARSISAAPAAPMPKWACRETVSASIKAASPAVLSVILPKVVKSCTSPPVLTFERLILLTAKMSIRPVPLLVISDPSARSTVPTEKMSIKNAPELEICARLFNIKSFALFCSFNVPVEALTLSEIVIVPFDLRSTAPPVTVSLTSSVPVVVRKI